MVIGRRSLLLAGAAVPVAAHSQCVTDTPSVDACRGGVRTTVPPGLTLDLSFGGPTLDSRLTFTRGSTATYFDATGTMQTVSGNAPRFDYDPVTHAALGLLIEEQRTNVWLFSANASNANWLLAGVVPPVVTANQTTAPDGTLTAAMVAIPSNGNTVIRQNITTSAAQYSFSIYLRGSVGGEQTYLFVQTGAATYYSVLVTLTTAWQRFTITTPTLTATAWSFSVGVDTRDVTQTIKPAVTVYMWGGQVEVGTWTTSYIPTTAAAVTRSADVCTMATIPGRNTSAETWNAEFLSIGVTPTISPRILCDTVGSIAPLGYFIPAPPVVFTFDGITATATANTFTIGSVVKAAARYTSPTHSVCLNGGAIASGASVGFSGLSTLRICGDAASNTANGYIRRVRYWPRVLSNAELQQVTR